MSGIETIVGLALGVYPLVVSMAEFYKKGFEQCRRWKRFKTEFSRFINDVDMQKLRFKKVLKLFLKYAGIPDEELDKFMKDPKYEGWKRDDLVSLLEERLEDSYWVYTSTIEEMNRLMGELQTLLSLKNGKASQSPPSEVSLLSAFLD
jgi:hypothetical protein